MAKELPPGKGGQSEFGEHPEKDNITPTPQTGEGGLHIGVPSTSPAENRGAHSLFPQLGEYLANRDKQATAAEILDDQRRQSIVDHLIAKSLTESDHSLPDDAKIRDMIIDTQRLVSTMSKEEQLALLPELQKERAEIDRNARAERIFVEEVQEWLHPQEDDEEEVVDSDSPEAVEKWLRTVGSDIVGTDYDEEEDYRVERGPLAGLQRVGDNEFWIDYKDLGGNKERTTKPEDIQEMLDASRQTQDKDNVLWIYGTSANDKKPAENVTPPDDKEEPDEEEQAS